MKLVYIAGPITKGNLAHNINQGTAAFLALTKAGIASICPMWSTYSGIAMTASPGPYSQNVDLHTPLSLGKSTLDITGKVFAVAGATPNDLTHAEWLAVDFEFIRRCDAVLRLPGESTGADLETAHANELGIPVFHDIADAIAWASKGIA